VTGGPIVVVGDALLDVDLVGSASRMAPDAPIPVLDDPVERARPGGAALAAAMLAADGADVVLVTALGTDAASGRLRDMLAGRLRLLELPLCGQLARKTRLRAGGHSIARIDSGDGGAVGPVPQPQLHDALAGAAAVLVSDYGRGTAAVTRDLLTSAGRQLPLVWDPHPRGARPVPGATSVTPNLAEAVWFTGAAEQRSTASGRPDLAAVNGHARFLVRSWQVRSVCVTMGAAGALVSFGDENPLAIPAPQARCVDPCGAGDRFAGSFAAALAAGALPSEAAELAVRSASAFVEQGPDGVLHGRWPGMAPGMQPPPADLADQLATVRAGGGTVVATGGCFDLLHAGHVETLRAARALGDVLVVCLNSDASVRRLKGPTRPIVAVNDRRRLLEALEFVDAVVVFDDDTPERLLRQLRPDVWVKGGDYDGRSLPEAAVLAGWGGQTVVVPYLRGRSTTALLDAVSSRRS
jgi:rfaE bifunctional protein nucleotidyltransferase chain/domain/rfaE bifunctional protein kinase chain/domain